MNDPAARPPINHPATIAIALMSFALGLVFQRIPWLGVGFFLAFGGMVVTTFAVTRALLGLLVGVRCPKCGQTTLERRAVVGFGDRFYSCSSCGLRQRRKFLGLWQDASEPQFDPFYQGVGATDPWSHDPDFLPEEGEPILSPTHANLLQKKRHRHPEQPNGPGLMP